MTAKEINKAAQKLIKLCEQPIEVKGVKYLTMFINPTIPNKDRERIQKALLQDPE